MREVLFKNLTSVNSKKKDILLKEVFEKNGFLAQTERRCFYVIKGISHLEEADDLKNWINSPASSQARPKRHFYILKHRNDTVGEDKLICKIAGTFYAIVDKNVYTIAFLHSFKVRFVKMAISQ